MLLWVPLFGSLRTNIAGSNIIGNTLQFDQSPGPTATSGNSPSIFHFDTFMTMKIISLTEHYSHQFCMRLIICINSQRTMSFVCVSILQIFKFNIFLLISPN